MKRTNRILSDTLCDVVERFRFHREKAKSENPAEAETAGKLCEVEIWEMWVLTQE